MGLVWFTNNLRVADNQALNQAIEKHHKVLGIYCLDPRHFEYLPYGFRKTGKFRAKFLLETLADLKKNLENIGVPLFVFEGKPEDILPAFCRSHNTTEIYHQQEWTTEETAITAYLQSNHPSLHLHGFYDQLLFLPETIHNLFPVIPKVFTEFRKKVEKTIQPKRPLPKQTKQSQEEPIPDTPALPDLESLGYENFYTDARSAFPFSGGETSAWERIETYFWETQNLTTYKQTRNGMIGTEYSSKLSPWLANGSLSVRQLYAEIEKFENEVLKNQDTYWLKFELLWREYFKHYSMTLGNRLFYSGGPYKTFKNFKNNPQLFRSWAFGETTDDFINAHMNELRLTGWMSNRGRQNAASYLSTHLHVDWRWGAAWFENLLLDYDVHSNYCNWLYNSQIGNDPRQRIFRPKLQAERYDPNASFRTMWLKKI